MKMGKKKGQKKRQSENSQILKSLLSDVWPSENGVLERPDRFKYVRKILKPKGCVFCKALKQGINSESLVLHIARHSMVVMNKYPYNSGHLLVIPKLHTGDMQDLSGPAFYELQLLLKSSIRILNEVFKPQGINVGLNLGRVAGAGVPDHLHWHIIPRWFGDTNFFPLIAETKVLPVTTESAYSSLSKEFAKLRPFKGGGSHVR